MKRKTVGVFRMLLPVVMKKIHPDLFIQHGEEVRETNAECTKTIMALWRDLETLEEKVSGMHGRSLLLPPALDKQYRLKCFARKEEDELVRIASVVDIPTDFHCRAPLAQTTAVKHMAIVCRQLEPFLHKLGIREPFKELQFGGRSISGSGGGSVPGLVENDGFAPKSAVDALRKTTEKRLAELQMRESQYRDREGLGEVGWRAGAPPGAWYDMISDVRRFLGSGNVVVKSLSPAEEVKSLQHLEKFLIEYGAVMNFSMDEWWRAILVLDGHASEHSVNHEKGRVIVHIPAQFKNKILLRFFRENVDMTEATTYF